MPRCIDKNRWTGFIIWSRQSRNEICTLLQTKTWQGEKIKANSMIYSSAMYKCFTAEAFPFDQWEGYDFLSNENPWKMVTSATYITHKESKLWAKGHFCTKHQCVLTGTKKKRVKGTMGILVPSACGFKNIAVTTMQPQPDKTQTDGPKDQHRKDKESWR